MFTVIDHASRRSTVERQRSTDSSTFLRMRCCKGPVSRWCHPAVHYVVGVLERSRGARPLHVLAAWSVVAAILGWIPIGGQLSPKAFGRIRRFAAVLRRIEGAADVD